MIKRGTGRSGGLAILWLAVATLLAACRGAEAERPQRPVTAEDLPDLVLQESDAPPGFAYESEAFDVRSLRPQLRDALLDHGFVAGWGSGFATETYGPNAGSVVMLFEDEAGASFAMRLMRDDLADLLAYTSAPISPLDAEGLGDESIGLQQQGGFSGPLYALFWRVDNVMLMVSSGALGESHFRELTNAVQGRTD